MQIERWRWRCEHARCGGDIGDRIRMEEIADMHRRCSGHATFVERYFLPPALPQLSTSYDFFPGAS